MGGGLPAAAFGGAAEVMSRLAPSGPVYQAGTLSGNPVAVAAGIATLQACTEEVYLRVDARGGDGRPAGRRGADEGGRAAPRADRRQPVLGVLHRGRGARLRRAPGRQQAWRYPAFFHAMLDRGVYLPPSAYEAWFVSAAHDDAVLDRIADALPEAARAAAAASEESPA
jgi:glutamate-1-semialdehyde 2,1-aminomutase